MPDRGEKAVAEAREWIGTPVVWEASLKGIGCDCRGLVAGVARELGWPEGSAFEAGIVGYSRRIDGEQLVAGLDRLFDRVEKPEPGDILAFRIWKTVQHLAIHNGERMIHAYLGEPAQVVSVPIDHHWQKRLAGIWRWRDGS